MPETIDPIDLHVGARLRKLRLALKLTQEEFGEEVGVSYQQIQNYETGANRISASRLFRIASILAVSPGWFFDELPPTVTEQLQDSFSRSVRAVRAKPVKVAPRSADTSE